MKKLLLLLLLSLSLTLSVLGQEFGKRITIGVVADSRDFKLITGMVEDIRSETSEILGSSYTLVMPEENVRYCDWQLDQAQQILNDYLADPDIEIVVGVRFVFVFFLQSKATYHQSPPV